jgi:hypothetical protein
MSAGAPYPEWQVQKLRGIHKWANADGNLGGHPLVLTDSDDDEAGKEDGGTQAAGSSPNADGGAVPGGPDDDWALLRAAVAHKVPPLASMNISLF